MGAADQLLGLVEELLQDDFPMDQQLSLHLPPDVTRDAKAFTAAIRTQSFVCGTNMGRNRGSGPGPLQLQVHLNPDRNGAEQALQWCRGGGVPELTAADVDERTDALLAEAEAYFMGEGGVHSAAAVIAGHLAEAGIDYAIAGAIALGEHGFKRLTVDVDVLIRREDLGRFKDEWLGRGYVEVRAGGKAVRDTINNVKIDFLITGDFPGDGKPKPVAFPDPREAAVAGGKYRVVSLPRLVEMKLASGMTAPHRLQDLADVLRLIREAGLTQDFGARLDPYVRDKFQELWLAAQHPEDDY